MRGRGGLRHGAVRPDAQARRRVRESLGIPESSVVVLHLGWHWRRKGGDLLAGAARRLLDRGHDDLVFLSLGAPSSEVLSPVTSLPFRERVEELHQAADIFVSASRSEGFGNGLVEGLASSCVAVGTLVEGQREIFEGLRGVARCPSRILWRSPTPSRACSPNENAGPSSAREPRPHRPQLRAARLGSPDGGPVRRAGGAAVTGPARVLTMIDSLIAGGAERVAVDIACGLDRDRFTPHVVVTRHGGPLEAPLRAAGVQFTVLDRTGRLSPAALRRTWAWLAGLTSSRPQVPSSAWGALLAHAARVPLVTHDHNWSAGRSRGRSLVNRRWIAPAAHRMLCVSRSVARALAEEGVPLRKIEVAENGIHLQTHPTREEARRRLGLEGSELVVGSVAALRPRRRTSSSSRRSPCCAPRNARCGSVSSAPGRARRSCGASRPG